MQTRDSQGRFMFDWWCPISYVDGYGRHAVNIYKGFQSLGVAPNLKEIQWPADGEYLDAWIRQEKYTGAQKFPSKISVTMSVPYSREIGESPSMARLVVTQFETDHIPERHIDNVNCAHHLITTSSFQPKVWRKSGLEIPIDVLRPGIDTDYFKYVERPKDGKFKILILGALTGRKNPLGAIRIFQRASQGDPNWRLTIKTRRADGIEDVARVVESDPRIALAVGDSHPDYVKYYYEGHDVFLWPSKGEGVGLPPLEAMATGMEVLCSANSGMLDYCRDDILYPIKNAGQEPADIPGQGFSQQYVHQFGSVGNWWIPDENHAVDQLTKCYNNWLEGKTKGKRAAEYVRENHNLQVQAQSILKVVQRYE